MRPEMRVVSGIQPTGNLHLGNYLGAIRNWVRMQDEMKDGEQCLFFLADLHAISMPHTPAELHKATLEMAAAVVACGIDPQRSVLFNQAQVPAHAELQWLLNGTARMGWLNRMTQWKDKAGKNREGQSVALFGYPVLQAADVLLYQTTHVPVGEDQKQHLELTRDIAAKFNHDYGVDFFPITEPVIEGAATRVMSLRDGSKKMSKSDPSDASRINMTDDADTIAKKIRKAKTDPDALPSEAAGLEDRPEARNLVNIYAALNEQSVDAVLAEVGGQQFGTFKPKLAELAVAKMAPISTEMARLMADTAEIDRILAKGAEQAREITAPILKRTYEIVGMVG